jgi:integrase
VDVPLFRLTAGMIHESLKELERTHYPQARRALKMMEQMFDFAKVKKNLILYRNENQAQWKGLHSVMWPKRRFNGESHHAAMKYGDVPNFLRTLRERQGRSSAAVALEFLILTVCRSSEVLGMRWDELDDQEQPTVWTVQAARMRMRKEHRVPLTPRILQLLKLQYSPGPYVFSGQVRGRPLEAKALYKFLRNTKVQGATVHGFRSSFRDWGADKTDYAMEVLEECLAHRIGGAVVRAYRRGDALDKRREVMEAWERFCCGL